MKYFWAWLLGIPAGCLLMIPIRIPWLPPLEANAATVIAACCSTVLAVGGAFFLWWHQVQNKRRSLESALVPIFDPLYTSLRQLLDLSQTDSAGRLLETIRRAYGPEFDTTPTDEEAVVYQINGFPRALDAAMTEARTALAPLTGIQDLVLSVSPALLPEVLAMQRLAHGAVDQLPGVLLDWQTSSGLAQLVPSLSTTHQALLQWAVGRAAVTLNRLDGGKRDEAGFHAMQAGRLAAMNAWAATAVH